MLLWKPLNTGKLQGDPFLSYSCVCDLIGYKTAHWYKSRCFKMLHKGFMTTRILSIDEVESNQILFSLGLPMMGRKFM
jgi:hypothetical protein